MIIMADLYSKPWCSTGSKGSMGETETLFHSQPAVVKFSSRLNYPAKAGPWIINVNGGFQNRYTWVADMDLVGLDNSDLT